jgi:hypothetical protein
MRLYPGPSCPDRPSFEEFSVVEINTWIHKVLDLGANPNTGPHPTPLPEGVASTRVSLFRHHSAAYTILFFHHSHDLLQGLRGAHSKP